MIHILDFLKTTKNGAKMLHYITGPLKYCRIEPHTVINDFLAITFAKVKRNLFYEIGVV